jgi:hypothetical protein
MRRSGWSARRHGGGGRRQTSAGGRRAESNGGRTLRSGGCSGRRRIIRMKSTSGGVWRRCSSDYGGISWICPKILFIPRSWMILK